PLLLAPFGLRIGLRQGNARHVGDLLHGFGEVQPFEIGQETEMIAGHTAAKTMVAALAVLAMEARALLAMERAAGPVIAPRDIRLLAIPGHATPDHGRDRHAVADFVEKTVGETHLHLEGQSAI